MNQNAETFVHPQVLSNYFVALNLCISYVYFLCGEGESNTEVINDIKGLLSCYAV